MIILDNTAWYMVRRVHLFLLMAVAGAVVVSGCSNNPDACSSDSECGEEFVCASSGGVLFGAGTCVRPCDDEKAVARCRSLGGKCRNGYCVRAPGADDAFGSDTSVVKDTSGDSSEDGCTPPTDYKFCVAQGLPCGEVSGTDRCGNERSLDCRDLIDFNTSEKHCGACGHSCVFTHSSGSCQNGSCVIDSCGPGWANGDGSADNGCECKVESETCNGEDDDCDGKADETCDCQPGNTQSCYTGSSGRPGVGICESGTQTCDGNGNWGGCSGDVGPEPEACDDKDNDCDGATDEGCDCNYQNKSTGVCADASIDGDGNCTPPSDYQSTESSCDGKDNDCDGVVDGGCSCNYQGQMQGVCGSGVISSSTGKCEQPTDWEPAESACGDGKDNDCDGKTDMNDSSCGGSKGAGAKCSSDSDCLSGECDATTSGMVCAHRVFVTSADYQGRLGGLVGADQKCQSAATSASLGGTWKAILSTSSTSAKSRLNVVSGIQTLNGNRVTGGPGGLWNTSIDGAISYDENNNWISVDVWTGTSTSGTFKQPACAGWNSSSSSDRGQYGQSNASTSAWIDAGPPSRRSCSARLHLYCIDGQ